MRNFIAFLTLFAVAIAAPQGFDFSSDLQQNPGFTQNRGLLNRIINGLPLPELVQQIDSLLNNIESLLPRLEGSRLERTPVGSLLSNLLLEVRAILLRTLAQLEKVPNTVNNALVEQLTALLERVESILNNTLTGVNGSLQEIISGVIGDVTGIIRGPVLQLVPDLLTRVIRLLQNTIDKLV
ncbi:uncharacterized protein [Fopius arisanus]|uniref:AroE protein n=1 Tax=Fopius arisanus TaxID=64838 RepID=A0A0C9RJX4_9HYME|nr:PREDICTED: uncharacterized protein LOC105267985 [Fopius arisanus]